MAHYEHKHVGYNYRMSNILAALGRAQLVRLDEMIARRREIRAAYADVMAGVEGITVFQGHDSAQDNCWLTALVVEPDVAPVTASMLLNAFERLDIEARPLWKPMHLQPIFIDAPAYVSGTAERIFQRGVTLPSGSVHPPEAIERVCAALSEIVGAA